MFVKIYPECCLLNNFPIFFAKIIDYYFILNNQVTNSVVSTHSLIDLLSNVKYRLKIWFIS